MTDFPSWPPAGTAESERLPRLGWDDRRQQEFDALDTGGAVPGRVARVDRGVCTVLAADVVHRAAVPPRVAPPVVGDWAAVRPAVPGGDDAAVRALLERRTSFTRQAAGEETLEQVVAANVDVVFLVNALDQRFSLRRLERYLTLGWQSGATPVIVLTKTDLCDDVEGAVRQAESVAFGVEVLAVSVATGEGLDRIGGHLEGHRTVALLGLSGSGKSTLINQLIGEERLRTQDVRQDGRGRHTTTHRELIPLPAGGVVIDTPGMRSVGLWDGDGGAGLEQTFSDVQELATSCRFTDCRHEEEPGCAVTAAITAGTLPAERLASYTKLLRELRFQELKQDKRARADERRRWRSVSKAMRNAGRPDRD
ncbi:MAG TPA: ribosome small subunit-dependent GTPase A [Gaiellales bacterium]